MTRPDIRDLPRPKAADGTRRRVGIEVEFAGLEESDIARLMAESLGGSARQTGPFAFDVTGGMLGGVKVVLDTKYRSEGHRALVRAGLELARGLVPAEIVTDPIDPRDIPALDAALDALVRAGATGTDSSQVHGFGTHLNVQTAEQTVEGILPVLRAYALIEAGLRRAEPIDSTRALLPFVRPYSRRLVDRLAAPESDEWSIDDMIGVYLDLAPSRNHALDMLPVLADLDRARVDSALGDGQAVSARPAFHFRLPDALLGDPAWSVAGEWNRWVDLERLAGDTERMAALRADWQQHRERWLDGPGDWAERAAQVWTAFRGDSA